jgi:hypothetical protein
MPNQNIRKLVDPRSCRAYPHVPMNCRASIALAVVIAVLAVGTAHAALVCAASRHQSSEHCRGRSGQQSPASRPVTPPCCFPDASVSPGQALKNATSTHTQGPFGHGLLLAKLLPVDAPVGLSFRRLARSSSGYPSSSPPRRILLSTLLL